MKCHLPLIAMLLLGTTTLVSNVSGQTIYKCGNAYSQSPCPGAVTVDTNDSRTPAQKAQADAMTAQAAKSADKMEKERVALEKARVGKAPRKASKTSQIAGGDKPGDGSKTSAKKKKKEPEFFTAAVAPDLKKEKKADKKSAGPAPVPNADTPVKP